MLWLPTDRLEVERAAVLPVRLTVPRLVAPSKKVTEPVGLPPVTVAVNMTDWPYMDGLSDEASEVLVVSWLTTWCTMDEVLVASSVSPLYVAVMLCPPTERVEMERAAVLPVRL